LADNIREDKTMDKNEKFAMKCEIDILRNAISDICIVLTEIDGFEEDAIQAVLARCAYSRGQTALRITNGSN
jgi:5'-3' exonuclease